MTRTWYGAAFPDGFRPEVFVLAAEAHRARIEAAIRNFFRAGDAHYGLRAFTFAGAIARLAPLVAPAAAPATAPAPPATGLRTITVDRDLDVRVRSGMTEWTEAYFALRYRLADHAERCPSRLDIPAPGFGMTAFTELLWHRILGRSTDRPKGWKV
jgi:hypothetical protein